MFNEHDLSLVLQRLRKKDAVVTLDRVQTIPVERWLGKGGAKVVYALNNGMVLYLPNLEALPVWDKMIEEELSIATFLEAKGLLTYHPTRVEIHENDKTFHTLQAVNFKEYEKSNKYIVEPKGDSNTHALFFKIKNFFNPQYWLTLLERVCNDISIMQQNNIRIELGDSFQYIITISANQTPEIGLFFSDFSDKNMPKNISSYKFDDWNNVAEQDDYFKRIINTIFYLIPHTEVDLLLLELDFSKEKLNSMETYDKRSLLTNLITIEFKQKIIYGFRNIIFGIANISADMSNKSSFEVIIPRIGPTAPELNLVNVANNIIAKLESSNSGIDAFQLRGEFYSEVVNQFLEIEKQALDTLSERLHLNQQLDLLKSKTHSPEQFIISFNDFFSDVRKASRGADQGNKSATVQREVTLEILKRLINSESNFSVFANEYCIEELGVNFLSVEHEEQNIPDYLKLKSLNTGDIRPILVIIVEKQIFRLHVGNASKDLKERILVKLCDDMMSCCTLEDIKLLQLFVHNPEVHEIFESFKSSKENSNDPMEFTHYLCEFFSSIKENSPSENLKLAAIMTENTFVSDILIAITKKSYSVFKDTIKEYLSEKSNLNLIAVDVQEKTLGLK